MKLIAENRIEAKWWFNRDYLGWRLKEDKKNKVGGILILSI